MTHVIPYKVRERREKDRRRRRNVKRFELILYGWCAFFTGMGAFVMYSAAVHWLERAPW